jgi:Secretion system C-terminal sorting domain
MKTVFLFVAISFLSINAVAQKIWLGTGGNKLWNNGANWSPAGTPGTLDNVIVNISDSVEVNQAVNINSLTITNNSAVIFNVTTTSRTLTVSSTSSLQLGLLIDASSSLTCQATIPGTTTTTLNLALTGGIGVTGEIYGSLYFKSVGAGTGGSNSRLDTYSGPVAYGLLKVKNGGLIKYDDKSGNTASAGSPTNSISMESGSTYWINKNGGSFPDGLWNAGSLCKSTGMVANGPTFNGITYGNLEWNNTAQTSVYGFNKDISFNNITVINTSGNVLRVKSGAAATSFTLTVNGNLELASGTTLETSGNTVTAPNGGVIELKGNLVNNGILTETAPAGTKDTLTFSGTTAQAISGTGTYTNQLTIKINNATGVTLNTPVSLPYLLLMRTGNITTSTTSLLTLQSACNLSTTASTAYTNLNIAGYTNYGADNSYIIGPVRKLGLSATARWAFPVGSATQFRPMFLTNVTGDFTVEYKQSNPRADYGVVYGAGLDHISRIEYWLVDGVSSPTASVELSFIDPNSGGVTVMADLRVARHNGTQWNNEGNTATIGSAGANGTVTSGTVTTFSPFSLASSTPDNPLPLKTIVLTATKNNSRTDVQWQVNADSDVKEYLLEKSGDGRNFLPVFRTDALRSAQTISYRFTDVLNENRIYYRVKAVLQNDRVIYSSIVILPGKNETVVLYPNPAKNVLQVISPKAGGFIFITDATGRIVYTSSVTQQTTLVNVQQWAKGYYQLQLTQPGNKTAVRSFIVAE